MGSKISSSGMHATVLKNPQKSAICETSHCLPQSLKSTYLEFFFQTGRWPQRCFYQLEQTIVIARFFIFFSTVACSKNVRVLLMNYGQQQKFNLFKKNFTVISIRRLAFSPAGKNAIFFFSFLVFWSS